MVSQLIQNELRRADVLRQEFERIVYGREECKLDERSWYLLAYWSLAKEHHLAMITLIVREIHGSAAALLRPIVEAVVRGHLVLFCSAKELERIRKDKYHVNFSKVGRVIDKRFGLETFLQDFLRDSAKILHSYTHGGILPVQRRYKDNTLQPNYQDDELVGLIHTTTSGLFLLTNILTKHLGYEEEWKRATALYVAWGKAWDPIAAPWTCPQK